MNNGHLVDLDFKEDTPDWGCSFIRSAQDTAAVKTTFRTVLADIVSDKYAVPVSAVRAAYQAGGKDAAAEPKKRLPGVLFSGLFSRRSAAALTQHSGLICADLDELGDRLEQTFEQVCADPHTLACFRSPTGTGLKVVFRCDPAHPHGESFRALEHYMLEHFGLEIDQACKDVSRICFVSHDPHAFVADNATPLPYPAQPKEFVPAGINPRSGLELTPGDDYDARGDFAALLTAHGWTKCHGGWTRPGKTTGLSATFDRVPGRFYVFSSSVPGFEPAHVYRPWHVYAILEHLGDFAAAARELGKKGFGTQVPSRQQKNLDRLAGPPPEPKTEVVGRSPFSFTIPPKNDKSILLGDRYLNRGDGMVLSCSSGMGKSSMQSQMAAEWGLGESFYGIKPNGTLRSLIVQSEDSDGDIAEVWQSMAHVRQWTQAQRKQLDANVRIISERSLRGLKFIAWLKTQVEAFNPDLVWINPLQAFIDGDVTDSRDLGAFLREGLNGINRDGKFGYVLIHHTTKPATGKDRHERLWHEVMYDMAGGAEIINWARAIISLRPTEEEGQFKAVLAKRGRRAGIVREVEQGAGVRLEPVTQIGLKHATGRLPDGTPIIFWEPANISNDPAPMSRGGGRPPSHHFADYRSVFPAKSSPGLPLNQLQRLLDQQRPIKKDALFRALKRWAEDGDVEVVSAVGKSDHYRAAL